MATEEAPAPAAGGGGGSGGGGGGGEASAPLPALARVDPEDKAAATLNAYSSPPEAVFQVRGPAYLTDRVKVPSGAPVFELVHSEGFRVVGRLDNVAGQPGSFVQRDRELNPGHEYLVVSYQTPEPPWSEPAGARFHVVNYFRRKKPEADAPSTPFERAWKKFREGSDAYRASRWKVFPHLADGAWVVSMAMGSRPALLCNKLMHAFFITPDYTEIDCDVSNSLSYLPAISTLIGLLQQYAKSLVIDVGFAIEAQEEGELPEAIIGAVRLHHASPNDGPVVDVPVPAADKK